VPQLLRLKIRNRRGFQLVACNKPPTGAVAWGGDASEETVADQLPDYMVADWDGEFWISCRSPQRKGGPQRPPELVNSRQSTQTGSIVSSQRHETRLLPFGVTSCASQTLVWQMTFRFGRTVV